MTLSGVSWGASDTSFRVLGHPCRLGHEIIGGTLPPMILAPRRVGCFIGEPFTRYCTYANLQACASIYVVRPLDVLGARRGVQQVLVERGISCSVRFKWRRRRNVRGIAE